MSDALDRRQRLHRRQFPVTNEAFGAGMGRRWDDRELGGGWQRVPGTVRVVSGAIPSPTVKPAPQWAQPRGVVSENGSVYDYETGRLLRPLGGA